MRAAIEEYVRGLGLDSKDADFLVPHLDVDGLKRALAPHGRVEDLVVAGRLVGVRLHPRDRRLRTLVPAGIELAPPRREVSVPCRRLRPSMRSWSMRAASSAALARYRWMGRSCR